MLGIFVLLIIAMLLVVRFCKKTLKIGLSIILILGTLYCIIFTVERNRVFRFEEPIFAVSSELRDYGNYSKEVYKGLGYTIEVDKMENQKIISITMYFLNRVIAAAIE